MVRLFGLIAVCLLFASLVGGSILHAADMSGVDHLSSEAREAVHVDGDHDPVPADRDGAAPDHHAICHGHDLPTPTGFAAKPDVAIASSVRCPAAVTLPASGPPVKMLRPPIA